MRRYKILTIWFSHRCWYISRSKSTQSDIIPLCSLAEECFLVKDKRVIGMWIEKDDEYDCKWVYRFMKGNEVSVETKTTQEIKPEELSLPYRATQLTLSHPSCHSVLQNTTWKTITAWSPSGYVISRLRKRSGCHPVVREPTADTVRHEAASLHIAPNIGCMFLLSRTWQVQGEKGGYFLYEEDFLGKRDLLCYRIQWEEGMEMSHSITGLRVSHTP